MEKKPKKVDAPIVQETVLPTEPFSYIIAKSRYQKLQLQLTDVEPKLYKAYCRTHGEDINKRLVSWNVLLQTIADYEAKNPNCDVSYKQLIN